MVASWREQVGDQGVVEHARHVALEAADELGLGRAFGAAPRGVGAGAFAVAQAADCDHVQRAVAVALAAVVEASPTTSRSTRSSNETSPTPPRRRAHPVAAEHDARAPGRATRGQALGSVGGRGTGLPPACGLRHGPMSITASPKAHGARRRAARREAVEHATTAEPQPAARGNGRPLGSTCRGSARASRGKRRRCGGQWRPSSPRARRRRRLQVQRVRRRAPVDFRVLAAPARRLVGSRCPLSTNRPGRLS